MDEKTQKESETQTQPELSGHTDSIPATDKIEQNTDLFENLENEPESIDSEMKAISNHAIDNLETIKSFDKADESAGTESGESEPECEHETLPSGAKDDEGALEKEGQNDTKEGDHDRGEIGTADRLKEEVAQFDSIAVDDVGEIQGSSEKKAAIEDMDEKLENDGDVKDDDQAAPAQIEPETTAAD